MSFLRRRRAVRIQLRLGPVSEMFPNPKDSIVNVLTDMQKVSAGPIQPVDGAGHPAPVDGVPVWAVSDEKILTVTPSADGLSADIETTGELGTAQVTVTADADLGAGVVPAWPRSRSLPVRRSASTFRLASRSPSSFVIPAWIAGFVSKRYSKQGELK